MQSDDNNEIHKKTTIVKPGKCEVKPFFRKHTILKFVSVSYNV